MNERYSAAPDGYCGDEDNGQTSAWYVFSALGFYPVCPGSGQYVLGTPYFKNIRLHLENGNIVEINAPASSDTNKFIDSMQLNGKDYQHNYLTHEDLIQGAKIEMQMAAEPNKNRGIADDDVPYSFTNQK